MKKPFEEKLLEAIEPFHEEYNAFEAFRGCFSLGLHIWMANFNTAQQDPFSIINEILKGAMRKYKDHDGLHFGPSLGEE